jgi:adenylate cyclase
MSQGQRRLAAIMFTDMVAYTALGQKNESLSLALVEEQRKLIRPILGRHNGREVKTMGDAFFVEFPNALDAVRCAYDIQRATKEFNVSLPEERRIHLRVGVHLGDIVESGGDISGDAVNIASRIEPLAEDGGVCLTRQVYDQVRNKFELQLSSLGERTLKNVTVPVEVFKMMLPWEKEPPLPHLDASRVAVLPFANISAVPEDEYFADGMTEEVIASVSRMGGLKVISRTSVMQFKNTQKRTGEIARELEVGMLVEGSVRKAGNRVRITVQLIDAEKDEHRWVQSWDRNIDDIFSIQSEIAKKIASSLKVRLGRPGRLVSRANKKEAAEAYDLYLRGWHMIRDAYETVDSSALSYLQAALRLDPSSAIIHNGIARFYVAATGNQVPESEGWPKVKEFAEKAASLDPEFGEAHLSLAIYAAQHDWDWARAEGEFREAIRLDPNSSQALEQYSFFLMCPMGLFDEAESYMKNAEELDPLSLKAKGNIAWVQLLTRRYAQAEAKVGEMRRISPITGTLSLVRIYLETSRKEKALAETRDLEKRAGYSFLLGHVGYFYGALGKEDDARRILQMLLTPKVGAPQAFALGLTYLGLGEKREAIKLFNQACDERSWALVNAYQLPEVQRLKSEQGFKEIEEKMGIGPFLASRKSQ